MISVGERPAPQTWASGEGEMINLMMDMRALKVFRRIRIGPNGGLL
jgi:hypothetical protein